MGGRVLALRPGRSGPRADAGGAHAGVTGAVVSVVVAALSVSVPAGIGATGCGPAPEARAVSAPVYGYEVVRVFPHDRDAFTQGLVVEGGFFYESTGLFGESTLRKVEIETGAVLKRSDLSPDDFGEGLTALRDTIYQITWRNHRGYAWVERDTFQRIETFPYPWEGWGLTHDGERLVASDGSATLRFLDPRTRVELAQVQVRDGGAEVPYLNELEFVQGRVYANVLPSNRIAVIDPDDGRVEAWLDLTGLRDSVAYDPHAYILNGIAYDPGAGRLFVTGKWWPLLFELDAPTLHPEPVPPDGAPWATRSLEIRVTPNPCRSRARVEFVLTDARPAGAKVAAQLVDALGRLRWVSARAPEREAIGGRGSFDLDLGDLPSGAYFVRVVAAGGGSGVSGELRASSARILSLR